MVEIRAPGERVEAVRTTLARQFPSADLRTIVSVADTESNVVLKIRTALLLLTLVILAITTLCVSSNFSEMVIERSKEIGILKALGAAERKIAADFFHFGVRGAGVSRHRLRLCSGYLRGSGDRQSDFWWIVPPRARGTGGCFAV